MTVQYNLSSHSNILFWKSDLRSAQRNYSHSKYQPNTPVCERILL